MSDENSINLGEKPFQNFSRIQRNFPLSSISAPFHRSQFHLSLVSLNSGVSHGDEILLEFAVPFLWGTPLPDEDIQTKDSLLDMWTSFASTGYRH